MKLSDAIQLGAMITSQAFRALFKDDGACALGAALLAVGVSPKEARCSVRKLWPWALAVNADCPSCGLPRLVCQIIVHLNDDHRWTREKIGAWVAGIEPSPPPDDLPGGTLSTLCAASTIRGHATQHYARNWQHDEGRQLLIDLKPAKVPGLTVPPTVLDRADQVLE